jgi:hypothetical protein
MGFKRFGSPEPLKVVTVCEECKQDRPLMAVKLKGVIKQICGECLKHAIQESGSTSQE